MKKKYICISILTMFFMIGCSKQIKQIDIDDVSNSTEITISTSTIENQSILTNNIETTQLTTTISENNLVVESADNDTSNIQENIIKPENSQTTTKDIMKPISTSNTTQTIVETFTLIETTTTIPTTEDNSNELPQIPIE